MMSPGQRIGYAAIMLSALVVAYLLGRKRQSRLELTANERIGIALGAFAGAMIGAKLPYLLSDWEGLASGAAWFANGKTILFGLVGGYLGVEIAKWILEVRVKTGDAYVVPVAAAIAIGRLGCFEAGCCYGTPTDLPWGVIFSSAGDALAVARHPTQLYEAAFHGLAVAVFLWIEARGLFVQQRMKLYILAYLVYRFASETLRPEPRVELGLTIYQWMCLAFAPLFVLLWLREQKSQSQEAA